MSASIRDEGGLGVFATLRRGVALSPQLVQGIWVTLGLAVVAALGKVVVPLVVQQAVDSGTGAGGPDVRRVTTLAAIGAGVLLVSALCSAFVNVRLFRSSEGGLAQLRVRAFRHVHDIAVLTQNTERRGALVSRVTSDVDTISLFVQWGGIMLLVSVLQIGVSTIVMATLSWQLTIVVWACFVPVVLLSRPAQRRVSQRYTVVREKVGAMLGAISEAVVGAETIRAYGAAPRTQRRIDAAIDGTRRAMVRAQVMVAAAFSGGVLVANGVLAAVVAVGVLLGTWGDITAGQLVAMIFLAQMFAGPVQMATEILNELQNAVAGWRRVIEVIDTPVEVVDPGEDGVVSEHGPASVELRGVSFAYPGGPRVRRDVDLALPAGKRVAVVGATGSGKTTMAKLVCRLIDPVEGSILLDGVDLRDIEGASLRRRIVLVPQEGFLFEGSIADNVAYGLRYAVGEEPSSSERRDAAVAAMDELGLMDWYESMPRGIDSAVGQRGESLSAGERQLVAIARAHLAGGDLLVLDEATSAVDPATEVRIAQALERLTHGRSTLTIAHRLSTAEAADLVVVVDEGEVVQFGSHEELVAVDGIYAQLHGAWVAQTR